MEVSDQTAAKLKAALAEFRAAEQAMLEDSAGPTEAIKYSVALDILRAAEAEVFSERLGSPRVGAGEPPSE